MRGSGPGASSVRFDLVVPTVGRPSFRTLLATLARGTGPLPGRIVLVDDRPVLAGRGRLLADVGTPSELVSLVLELPAGNRGPAAARNVGWRATTAPWVAFLDDDVVPDPDWAALLADDLERCDAGVAAIQGRVTVPLPVGRRPTDWERNVARLGDAQWITADMAYRQSVLEALGGFDERFPRAYREDADLGLRTVAAGYRIVRGTRHVTHPIGTAPWYVSLAKQRGNADDGLMDRLHGRGWRQRAGSGRGRCRRHRLITAAGFGGLAAVLAGRWSLAAAGLGLWLAGTAELTWRRIAPGPRTRREVVTMVATSLVLPPVATVYWVLGQLRARRFAPRGASQRLIPGADVAPGHPGPIEAVLFDRDGTLVVDVPYNGDPARVQPMPGARVALGRLRAAGLRLAVLTNQSGIGRGLLTPTQVQAVNDRVEALLGPFDAWVVCPHRPDDGCRCRKPHPGTVIEAAAQLNVEPTACAVVGDIGADVEAAVAAGSHPILVPTAHTRPAEVTTAPRVVPHLAAAANSVLAGTLEAVQ